jgi:ABC-type transport system involved in multi-copper enzyme maturation permease subunit
MTTTPETGPVYPQQSRLGAFIRRNPIALKELRGRMRGSRAFVVLTVYVALMSLFTVLLYLIYTGTSQTALSTSGGVVGKLIFGGVVAIELFLVCFVAPAFTAGTISGEREHRTFHLLRTTLLSARRIVLGKLVSALAYVILLLLVAVPLQSLAFLMGGVTPEEVLLSVEILLVTAITYGAMGIFFSAVTRRTLTASILTYAVALATTIAMPLAALLLGVFSPLGVTNMNRPALEAILVYLFGFVTATNPISTAIVTETTLLQRGTVFTFTETLSNGASIPLVSPWIVYTVFYLLITLVLVVLAVRQVRQVEE